MSTAFVNGGSIDILGVYTFKLSMHYHLLILELSVSSLFREGNRTCYLQTSSDLVFIQRDALRWILYGQVKADQKFNRNDNPVEWYVGSYNTS